MLNAGASGYLLKEDAFEELAHAIRTVAAGQRYLSPQVKN
jgi:DNA-binding NarL/FixJ family response regulator